MKQTAVQFLLGCFVIFGMAESRQPAIYDAIGQPSEPQATDITKDRSLPEIEASGLLYLKDIDRYLLISDETDNHRPIVYMMNQRGHVEQTAPIYGLDRITDMESVCQGANGDIDIACSQSMNQKGIIPDSRKLFIRVARNRVMFQLKHKVMLYDLLQKALMNSKDPELSWLYPTNTRALDLNVEGIFFQNGSIFLGLKKPLNMGKAAILKISHINRVLEENRIRPTDLTLWKLLDVSDPTTGVPTGISDLCLHDNKLLILSYAKIEKNSPLRNSGLKKLGILWVLDLTTEKLSLIKRFENMQPEGLALRSDAEPTDSYALTVVFDNGGEKASQLMELKIEIP